MKAYGVRRRGGKKKNKSGVTNSGSQRRDVNYLNTDKKRTFIINTIFYGLIAILIWLVCKYIMPVLIPFILAFVIASIIRIPVKRFYGKSETKDKIISVLTCILFYGLFFTAVTFAGIGLYQGLSGLLSSIPDMYNNGLVPALNALISSIEDLLANYNVEVNIRLGELIKEHIGILGEYITSFSANAIKFISGGVTQIPGFIIKFVIMIISTFFCMIDYNKIMIFFIGLIPKGKEHVLTDITKYFKSTVLLYIKSYSMLFMLTFVELLIGFSILRVEQAPLLAILVAIFDILPILGVGGVLLPWAVIGLITGDMFIGIGMLVLYLIIAFIRNMAEPKLIGNQIGLHPLATLVAMYLGLRFLGFFGMFLFPVTLSVIVGMKKEEKK